MRFMRSFWILILLASSAQAEVFVGSLTNLVAKIPVIMKKDRSGRSVPVYKIETLQQLETLASVPRAFRVFLIRKDEHSEFQIVVAESLDRGEMHGGSHHMLGTAAEEFAKGHKIEGLAGGILSRDYEGKLTISSVTSAEVNWFLGYNRPRLKLHVDLINQAFVNMFGQRPNLHSEIHQALAEDQ